MARKPEPPPRSRRAGVRPEPPPRRHHHLGSRKWAERAAAGPLVLLEERAEPVVAVVLVDDVDRQEVLAVRPAHDVPVRVPRALEDLDHGPARGDGWRRVPRGYSAETSRGAAAGATWIFRALREHEAGIRGRAAGRRHRKRADAESRGVAPPRPRGRDAPPPRGTAAATRRRRDAPSSRHAVVATRRTQKGRRRDAGRNRTDARNTQVAGKAERFDDAEAEPADGSPCPPDDESDSDEDMPAADGDDAAAPAPATDGAAPANGAAKTSDQPAGEKLAPTHIVKSGVGVERLEPKELARPWVAFGSWFVFSFVRPRERSFGRGCTRRRGRMATRRRGGASVRRH